MRISDWSSDVCSTDLAELGGRRPRQRSIDPQLNGFWQNQSFHNYADYALSSDFHTGFRRLLELSQRKTCAIMCSEAVWWRCHRRIVADYLLDTGRPVFHLMARSEEHTSELQSLMRISYAVFCLKKKKIKQNTQHN